MAENQFDCTPKPPGKKPKEGKTAVVFKAGRPGVLYDKYCAATRAIMCEKYGDEKKR